jgi:hypothetical protein
MRLITLTLAVLMLGGCAATRISDDYAFEPGTDEALLVASTRIDDKCGGSMSTVVLAYETLVKNDVETGGFVFTNPLLTHDFTNPPGYFDIRRVKAGEYRLTKLTKTSMAGRRDGQRDLNIQFRVDPGRIYYLGEMYVDMPDCSSFSLRFNDQRQRDGALFDRRMKRLKSRDFLYVPLGRRG